MSTVEHLATARNSHKGSGFSSDCLRPSPPMISNARDYSVSWAWHAIVIAYPIGTRVRDGNQVLCRAEVGALPLRIISPFDVVLDQVAGTSGKPRAPLPCSSHCA